MRTASTRRIHARCVRSKTRAPVHARDPRATAEGPELIVIPVDWLPQKGRHWYLFPNVDAVALSADAWESGQADAVLFERPAFGYAYHVSPSGRRPACDVHRARQLRGSAA